MYSTSFNRIVVWRKKDNTYYYRIYRKYFLPFEIGYHNSYGHEVVFIIDDLQEKIIRKKRHYLSQRKKNKIISFINNL